jgi:predicted signal transduction protein with EAL and GGDEF domain
MPILIILMLIFLICSYPQLLALFPVVLAIGLPILFLMFCAAGAMKIVKTNYIALEKKQRK